MSKPLPHSEEDSDLLPIGDNPMNMFWHLATLATGLIVVCTWLILIGLVVSGWIEWAWWLFCVAPIGGWLVLLGLPVLWHAQKGAVAVVAALAATAEAWLARAGYSIDLNRDGCIGWEESSQPIIIEPAPVVRPVLVTTASTQGVKLLTSDAPAAFTEPEPAASRPAPVWALPNGVTIPQADLEKFIDGIFARGWSRAAWIGAGKPFERDQYDGLIALLEKVGLLIDRKSGAAGRLTVRTSVAARAVMRLPTPTPTSGSGQQPTGPNSQVEPARPGPAQTSPVEPGNKTQGDL